MIPALIISALLAGLPVPEWLGKPVVMRLEALDDREPYAFVHWPHRLRWTATLPLLRETHNLPPLSYCLDQLTLNCRHRQWLEARAETNLDQDYIPWMRANELCWRWWDAACDAQRDYFFLTSRREALGKCVSMLSRRDWWLREFPPAIPFLNDP